MSAQHTPGPDAQSVYEQHQITLETCDRYAAAGGTWVSTGPITSAPKNRALWNRIKGEVTAERAPSPADAIRKLLATMTEDNQIANPQAWLSAMEGLRSSLTQPAAIAKATGSAS